MSISESVLAGNYSGLPDLGQLSSSVREKLGISQGVFSKLLGLSTPTVKQWEKEQRSQRPDPKSEAAQTRLCRLCVILGKLPSNMKPKDCLAWLKAPNRELEDKNPIGLLTSSDTGAMIVAKLAAGLT